MKFKLYASMAAITMLMAACNETSNGNFDISSTVPVINISTSLIDGITESSRINLTYDLSSYDNTMVGSITSTGFLMGGTNFYLNVPDTKFLSNAYTYFFKNVPGNLTGGNNFPVENGNFYLTVAFNSPYYIGLNTPFQYPDLVTFYEYNVDNQYRVNSFPEVTCFFGELTVNYTEEISDHSQSFYNLEFYSQLYIDYDKKTASIVFNDIDFSNFANPISMLRLSNLEVSFNNGKVIVKGSDIVPMVYDISGPYEYTDYLFNEIEFQTTSSDLTQGQITFMMTNQKNTVFEGTFKGSYLMFNPDEIK